MIPFALIPWRLVGIGAAIASCIVFGAWGMHKYDQGRYDRLQGQFEAFKAQVKANGDAAQKAAQAKELADQKRKETADHENATALATLADTIKRLRESNPASGIVPAAPAGSSRPDLSCFDRPELERATGNLVEELRRLADEGTAATVDLDTAKKWAQP